MGQSEGQRTKRKHCEIVKKSYECIYVVFSECRKFSCQNFLPDRIHFVTTTELYEKHPNMSSEEREDVAAREYGAIFLMEIGGHLPDGSVHGGRAPDYDDWYLNGDIIVWNKVLGRAFELSSMGIRVDRDTLANQMRETGTEYKQFHIDISSGKLPQTIGGGIGQSRLCQFILGCKHIAEVQSSWWGDIVPEGAM